MRGLQTLALLALLATAATVAAGPLNKALTPERQAQLHKHQHLDQVAKPTAAAHGRRRLTACDDAYLACLWNTGCMTCVTQASALGLEDDVVDDDMACSDFMTLLHSHDACQGISSTSEALVCQVMDACSQVEDDETTALDDTMADQCDPDSCDVTHPEWLGDGWCDMDSGPCYNSEGCGYDHGDCCEETCQSTQYIDCGIHGYDCKDPAAQGCSGDDLTLNLMDSYGDGWNGASYTVAEVVTGQQLETGTLASGSSQQDTFCLPVGCYAMLVNAGSWSYEISWELVGVAAGGAPAACAFDVGGDFCSSAAHNYTQCDDASGAPADDDCSADLSQLVLYDSFGDGWNGASYTLRHHASGGTAGAVVSQGTLNYGYQTTEYVCLEVGSCYVIEVEGGSWDSEISWELGNADGELASGGAPYSCQFPVGGNFCPDTCATGGDTDDAVECGSGEDEYSLALSDSYGDGWNGASYTLTDSTGGTVSAGTLPASDGDFSEYGVCLTDGECYTMTVSSGGWDEEISWQLGGWDSGVVAEGEGAGTCTFSTDDSCPNTCAIAADDDGCPGSSLPGGPTPSELVLYDSAGDGWDGAAYTITNTNTDIVLYSGTLASGAQQSDSLCLPVGCYSLRVSSGGTDSEISWFLDSADLSGSAPSQCQFHVGSGPGMGCATYCTSVTDDEFDNPSDDGNACSQWEAVAGLSAMTTYAQCTSPSIHTPQDIEDHDMVDYDWALLDDFELCAFNDSRPDWPEECMLMLSQATVLGSDSLVKKLAKNVYADDHAAEFCLCNQAAMVLSPSCADMKDFNALLHEGSEACDALDAIDCDYLETYTESCIDNLVDQFGVFDLRDSDQCEYVDSGCGGLVEPALRRWDCFDADEADPIVIQFAEDREVYCFGESQEDDYEPPVNLDDLLPNLDDWFDRHDDEEEGGGGGGGGGKHSDDGGPDAGAAIGITIAVLCGLGLVGGGGFFLYKRMRTRAEPGVIPGTASFSPMVFGQHSMTGGTTTSYRAQAVPKEDEDGAGAGAVQMSSGPGGYTPVSVQVEGV